jgi:hypothetical protein
MLVTVESIDALGVPDPHSVIPSILSRELKGLFNLGLSGVPSSSLHIFHLVHTRSEILGVSKNTLQRGSGHVVGFRSK